MNWTKNDRVRAVFVAEVKIPENEQFWQNRDFRRFRGNFDFDRVGSILGLLTPIFFILVNNCQFFRVVPCLDLRGLLKWYFQDYFSGGMGGEEELLILVFDISVIRYFFTVWSHFIRFVSCHTIFLDCGWVIKQFWILLIQTNYIFSLRRGDLIRSSCLSVRHRFSNFS